MGDPWSDQVSYTFTDYEMQEDYKPSTFYWPVDAASVPAWTAGDTFTISTKSEHDSVNHPKHYTSHPSGVECIQVTQHYNFCVGNAIKYLWRAGLKSEGNTDTKQKQIEDLNKAIWYIRREIENLETNKYEQT